MKTWAKIVAVLIVAAACFVGGYRYAAALYSKDIAVLRKDYATRAAQLSEGYRAREAIAMDSLRRAWEERDAAYAEADERAGALDDALGRMRDENAALRRRLSAASGDSCDRYRTSLGKCSRLLEEGAELLREGAEVRLRDAADIDAIRTVTESGKQK